MWRRMALAGLIGTLAWPVAAAPVPESAVTLRILTYNTWGLPVPIGRRVPERFSLIAKALPGFDWVTLQETFTGYADPLRALSAYPFRAAQTDGGFFKISSGLTTLSRFPIVERDFREFAQSTDFDRFSRKGVLFTRLQVKPGLTVDLYNTHYQAMDYPEAEQIRQHEDNRVLAEMVKAHDRGYPTFIQGDLNSHDHDSAYQDLMRRLPLHDLWRETRAGDPGWTMDFRRNANTQDLERLDYLFFLHHPRWQARVDRIDLAMTNPVGGVMMSDHLGVQARITLSGASPRRV